MGVRIQTFGSVIEIDDFLESRDDIDYIDFKKLDYGQYVLVYEEVPVEGVTLVKGFGIHPSENVIGNRKYNLD